MLDVGRRPSSSRLAFRVWGLTGVPRSQENTHLKDPAVALCLGPYGTPRMCSVRRPEFSRLAFPVSTGVQCLVPPPTPQARSAVSTAPVSARKGMCCSESSRLALRVSTYMLGIGC